MIFDIKLKLILKRIKEILIIMFLKFLINFLIYYNVRGFYFYWIC